MYTGIFHFIKPLSYQKVGNLDLEAPKTGFFGLYFMTEMTVLRSFLAYLAKFGTPEGPEWTEMAVYRHFMLYQSFNLPKNWKFGLLGHPNRVFGTVLHDRNDCF